MTVTSGWLVGQLPRTMAQDPVLRSFVTAFEQYAPDAFEVEAADYLLKPVRFDRLWQAVERAKRRRHLRTLAGRA